MKTIKIVIITGLSGSGKTTAINALEDAGFFCIDNLPVVLLPKFLELERETHSEVTKIAIVMDLREKDFLQRYPEIFSQLREAGYQFEIIFLEASTEILLQRYSQTRRKHPLGEEKKSVLESIETERKELKNLREIADLVINTSNYNVHELKEIILNYVLKSLPGKELMNVYVMSFGFKYGIPRDADLVIDVRFLPNPYFVPNLKHLNGTTIEVQEFMDKWQETKVFVNKYLDLLTYLIPLYQKEGKSSLTLAVGCTAGTHRSVTIAEKVYTELRKTITSISLTHRDIELST